MKKILITGANSYIGDSFKKFMQKWSNSYEIDTLDMIGLKWKEHNFAKYDVVYHVAGIAHRKETKENSNLYFEINRDLTLDTAKMAKEAGVKQFIYLSSMSVYGMNSGYISISTKEMPINAYGKSKFEAEKLLQLLENDKFKIAILRPPMVYGKGCKGNYQTLRKFALKMGIFPFFENFRSMIYIDNLSSVVKNIVDFEKKGVFFPQNVEYISTSSMVRAISFYNHKKIIMIKFLNPLIGVLKKNNTLIQKVFGSLVYDKKMNVPDNWIEIKDNDYTVRLTEEDGNEAKL